MGRRRRSNPGSSSCWNLPSLDSLSSSSARAVFVTEPNRSSLITWAGKIVKNFFVILQQQNHYHLDVLSFVLDPLSFSSPLLLLLLFPPLLLPILLALPTNLILPPFDKQILFEDNLRIGVTSPTFSSPPRRTSSPSSSSLG